MLNMNKISKCWILHHFDNHMWEGLPHTALNSYSANVLTILKIKNLKATIFQKPSQFLNFSYISTILGLPQRFDQQNCSSVKNSTKELVYDQNF